MSNQPFVRALAVGLLALLAHPLHAAPVANVANTKHNLSASGPGEVKAVTESQICVFCHTPHGANQLAAGPLWNRQLSTASTYQLYSSDSIQATIEQPGGSSKLCLSCHDGAMAIGKVNVLNGATDVTIDMIGTDAANPGTMPDGSGAATGFTRDLGTDLSNDHPISFTYDTTLAGADKELYDPSIAGHIGNRVPGTTPPEVPLENNQVQCISCHDPHIRDDAGADIKFLRLNRFQEANAPSEGSFNNSNDIVCLACHDKAGWSGSAHANNHIDVANEAYTDTAAQQRGFPLGIKVWEAACLNCHDSHTVQGARRLLREGTDSPASPKAGGNPAQEETCYQCHDAQANTILTATSNKVPNIKGDFTLANGYHMPITSGEQIAGSEVHSISDKDFTESPALLGKGGVANLDNRHAECTDCHNPHRVIKNRLFNATPTTPDAAGTHNHASGHTNIASGVLAGTTGVEPNYGTTTWGSLPATYDLKKGAAGPGASTAASAPHVTREYQICLKCHSDYAWDSPPNTPAPSLSLGLNGVNQYTNQAMEFQAPAIDKGEPGGNHRSWHPVIDNTGRDVVTRGGGAATPMADTNFLTPWNGTANVGNQTMYCSDCHGSDTGVGNNSVVPTGGEDGNPWGPHGSSNPFILKGPWNTSAAVLPTTDDVCFKCHDWGQYADPAAAVINRSGFSCADGLCTTGGAAGNGCRFAGKFAPNLHLGHAKSLGKMRCTWCHTAVPHGWKNKALLVSLKDAVGFVDGCNVIPCNVGPYYQNAYLGGNAGGVTWKASGTWTAADCGGATGAGAYMNGTCNNLP